MYDAVEIIVEIMVVPDGRMIVPSAGDGFMRTRVTLAYRERQVGSRADRNHRWRGDRTSDGSKRLHLGSTDRTPRGRGGGGAAGQGRSGARGRGPPLRSALRLPRAP